MSTPSASTAAQALVFADADQGEELQRAEMYGLLARLWFTPADEALLAQFRVAVIQVLCDAVDVGIDEGDRQRRPGFAVHVPPLPHHVPDQVLSERA